MNIKYNFFYTFSIIVLFFLSCTERIDLPLGNHEPKFTIQAELSNHDSTCRAFFSMSKGYIDNSAIININPDSVFIINPDGVKYMLNKIKDGYFESKVDIQYNKDYTFTCYYNNEKFEALSTLNPLVEIDSLYYWSTGFAGNNSKIVAANILEPIENTNYYRYFAINHSNNEFENYVFDDILINGTKISCDAFNDKFNIGDSIEFYLLNIDKNNYDYWTVNIENSTSSQSNSFNASPANPKSNISGNCYGYFSAHSTSIMRKKIL